MTEQQEDISSKTLLVLVLLTLAVSFIGAWVSYTAADTLSAGASTAQGPGAPAGGEVTLEILAPAVAQSDAVVGFEIIDRS